MVLYNVTVGIDITVEQEWLVWMKEEHIPEVMGTGLFVESKMYKVLGQNEDPQTNSYSIQYFAKNVGIVDEYLSKHAPGLIQKHQDRYGNHHVAFRTLLEEVV